MTSSVQHYDFALYMDYSQPRMLQGDAKITTLAKLKPNKLGSNLVQAHSCPNYARVL